MSIKQKRQLVDFQLVCQNKRINRRLVRSVGRAPVCWVGDHGFEPRPDQHSGSLDNWEESAVFVMTSANGYIDVLLYSDKDEKL